MNTAARDFPDQTAKLGLGLAAVGRPAYINLGRDAALPEARTVDAMRDRCHQVLALARHGLTGSMGRVSAAGDNAAMESFFALLQNNVLNRRTWSTRDELRTAIVTWIGRTYHRRRRQAA